MTTLIWVVLAFLLVVSIIDWKIRRLPSIFLTGMLFVVAFISVSLHPQALMMGVLGSIMAYLLYEADFFGGVADLKIMILISFMIINTWFLLGFFILIGIFGITWKAIIRLRLRKSPDEDFAFLPVFLFVFIALALLGGVA